MDIIALNVYYGTNCYIVCDSEKKLCAVIDPGGNAKKIADTVAESGCEPVAIMLTHGHFDHVRAVKPLRAIWGDIPVYLNRRDVFAGDDRRALTLFPNIGATVSYDEGDTVNIGSIAVHVLATPGHTPGGVSLLAEDALFCGDTIFPSSLGRTDLLGGSDADMTNSLRRIGAIPGELRLLPGHMEAGTLENERRNNPYLIAAMEQGSR